MEGKRKKATWFGEISDGETKYYKNLKTEFVEIFDMLRKGEKPEIEPEAVKIDADLRDMLIEYGKKRIKEEFAEDQFLIKFYALKLEIVKMINLYLERIINFGIITGLKYDSSEPCRFFKMVSLESEREDLVGIMDKISEMGLKLCSFRDDLSSFINDKIILLMPNTTELIGEDLTMELLLRSGGIKGLIKYPASTIQVLGAEKAFFKHMATGSPPPKHGVIFKYPGISSLPPKDRGKVARTLANKVAITIRADYFGGKVDIEGFKNKVKERIDSVSRKKK